MSVFFHNGRFHDVICVKESESGISRREISAGKITPDLVCKLSVQELESLGLTSRREMMALRIDCATFGGEAPRKVKATCGAPSFSIPKCVLESLLGEGFTIKEISTILFVSESTIYPQDESLWTRQVRFHRHFRFGT